MSQKADIAEWIRASMKRRGVNKSQVAKMIGVSRATMTRWCKPNDPTQPLWENISALAAALDSSPPGWKIINALPPAITIGGTERQLAGPIETGTLSEWRVPDAAMQAKGYMEGDILKVDDAMMPRDGDVVIANLYATEHRLARNAVRLFKAPDYLVTAAVDTANTEIDLAGKTARIIGVVVESIRRRQH